MGNPFYNAGFANAIAELKRTVIEDAIAPFLMPVVMHLDKWLRYVKHGVTRIKIAYYRWRFKRAVSSLNKTLERLSASSVSAGEALHEFRADLEEMLEDMA